MLLLAVVLVSSCSSCSSDKKNTDVKSILPPPDMKTDAEDTLTVNNLLDEYMGLMSENKVDEAAGMLYLVKDSEIVPLDGTQLKEFKEAWSKLRVYGVKKKGFMLRSARNNDITILLQILPNGNVDKEIGVATQHINPVYKEGKWFLTLFDPKAEGVYDVFDETNTNGNVEVVR